VPAETVARVEATLVQAARQVRPRDLAALGEQILARLDPDGTLEDERARHRRRGLTLSTRADGMLAARGLFPAPDAAVLLAALTPLAAPRPGPAGEPDPRSHPQRLADALVELAGYNTAERQLAESGAPATVILTMTREQAETGRGLVATSSGLQFSVQEALKMLDEAVIYTLIENGRRAVLELFRTRRIATRDQTYALIARDRGCSMPGCDKPPELCQRHHVIPWWRGGRTNIDNLTLLCHYHHREFERLGYTCRIIDGLPHWTAPPWIDPTQTPQLNQRITLRQ